MYIGKGNLLFGEARIVYTMARDGNNKSEHAQLLKNMHSQYHALK